MLIFVGHLAVVVNDGRKRLVMKDSPKLSLDDLQIADVDIYNLSREEAMGIPEMGATSATYGSCTCSSPCVIKPNQ